MKKIKALTETNEFVTLICSDKGLVIRYNDWTEQIEASKIINIWSNDWNNYHSFAIKKKDTMGKQHLQIYKGGKYWEITVRYKENGKEVDRSFVTLSKSQGRRFKGRDWMLNWGYIQKTVYEKIT